MTDTGTFLRDLAERLFRVPVMYGVDQGDCDRLLEIAATHQSPAKSEIWLALVPRLTAEEKDALEQLSHNRGLLESARSKMHFRTLDEAADFARDHL